MGIVKIPGQKSIWSGIKLFGLLLLSFVLLNCNSENAFDCFQNAGPIAREAVSVADFTKITVYENVELVVKQGDTLKVEVETGKYLRDEVSVGVEEGRLLLRDSNSCNFTRKYGVTRVYVTAPNITEIRSGTGLAVTSDGVLSYPILKLISESYVEPEAGHTSGEFHLEVDAQEISVISNGISYYNLKGNTVNFNILFSAGDSRLEAEALIADNVTFNHRGSNDIRVSPQLSLKGVLRGTGDLVCFTAPPIVEVEQLYKGALVFKP